ncbi:MMPL family transporter [Micromonospora sp. DT201]|uniref:MMPL family transporter n=1 Tax=Micromonospora sp. DT201 TaxID=3393442 RepID=UPI003CE9FAC1
MAKQPVTVRVARWSTAHPWLAILLWVAFVLVALIGGSATGLKTAGVADTGAGDSGRAAVIVDEAGFEDPGVENVLITARAGTLDQAAANAAAAKVIQVMQGQAEVAKVDQPVPAPDNSALLVSVTMKGDPETATERIDPLLAQTDAVQKEFPALRVEMVGNATLSKALNETLIKDFQRAELISIPLTLIILIFAFGALIAAGVPLILAISAVGAAMGLNSLASHLIPSTDSVSTIILLIGMAVGVDYSLFYLRREREERAKGIDHKSAIEIAAATSGHAVVVSGAAVAIAMAGLYLASDATFSSFATGAILVIAVAVLGSLTVLPALLSKFGRWVDRGRIPFLWKLTSLRGGEPRFWPAVLRPVLKAPAVALGVSVLLLLLLAVPALGMKLKLPGLEDLPRSVEAMNSLDRMTAAYPSTGTSFEVVVRAKSAQSTEVQTALQELGTRVAADPLFVQDGATPPRVSPDGRTTITTVATDHSSRSSEAQQALDRLREDLVPATVGKVSGVDYAVGGFVAGTVDYSDQLKRKLPLVVGFVLVLSLAIMMLTFRSVNLALLSIGLNLLSVGASFGLLVLIFQGEWAEGILNFTSIDAIVAWLPIFLFVILFGLSMDYHVFVVSRIREKYLRGVPHRQAVVEGITSSAGVVTSAAVVMVGVFSVFGTLSMIDMKQLGVGLAFAILIDASIIRGVVLPAAMAVLGERTWWAPKFMRRDEAPPVRVEPFRPADEVDADPDIPREVQPVT